MGSLVKARIGDLAAIHNQFVANLVAIIANEHHRPILAIRDRENMSMVSISRRLLLLGSLINGGLMSRHSHAHGHKSADRHRAIESLAATRLIRAAREQLGVTTGYDGSYKALDYPGGDIDHSTGVCVDVLIRAYRNAFAMDMQKLVHEDMKLAFNAYPKLWRLTRPDRNIDHRRVPNIETWLARQGTEQSAHSWQPGDIISMRLPGNLPHIAIISDKQDEDGQWLVIHNIGRGVREEKAIGLFNNERRFRFLPPIA